MSNLTEGGLYVLVMMKGKLRDPHWSSLSQVFGCLVFSLEAGGGGKLWPNQGRQGSLLSWMGAGLWPGGHGCCCPQYCHLSAVSGPPVATAHVDLELRQKFAIKIKGLGVSKNPLSIAFLPPHLFPPPKQETRKEDADMIVKT